MLLQGLLLLPGLVVGSQLLPHHLLQLLQLLRREVGQLRVQVQARDRLDKQAEKLCVMNDELRISCVHVAVPATRLAYLKSCTGRGEREASGWHGCSTLLVAMLTARLALGMLVVVVVTTRGCHGETGGSSLLTTEVTSRRAGNKALSRVIPGLMTC